MPPASPKGTSKPSRMFARWQSTGLVPPQQPPLTMKASGSPSGAAARTRSRSRWARGVSPSQAGMLRREEVHGEVVEIDPHLLQARQVLDHRHPVLAAVARELVAAEGGVRLDHVPGVDPHRTGLEPLGEAMGPLQVLRLDAGREPVDDEGPEAGPSPRQAAPGRYGVDQQDRKSTRLNSSHTVRAY